MKMTMNYEFISPEKAKLLLEKNTENRRISKGTVDSYVHDMLAGNWDESVGSSICIDENGIIRDGQHRLVAIVKSGVGIHTWVCRNVSKNGIYDNNRKRNNSDQITILRPDLECVYRSTRYISLAKTLIGYITGNPLRTVTPKEIIDFTDEHKQDLDGYFLVIPKTPATKINITLVHLSLFIAYKADIKMEDICNFYDILCTGMSTKQEEFPIIAYRNYLKDQRDLHCTLPEISRCQYALKKYLTGSCTKKTIALKELIWRIPYKGNK